MKQELFEALYEHREDFNYCVNGIAKAVKPYLEPADLIRLFELTEQLGVEMTPAAEDEAASGFVTGCASLLAHFELDVVKANFLRGREATLPSEATVRILCRMLYDCHSTAALELAAELLLAGVDLAATSIYFIAPPFRAPAEGLSWASFHRGHVDRLLDLILGPDDRSWGVKALLPLCEARADLAGYVATHARSSKGIHRAALQYCVSRADQTIVFESLSELADMSPEQLRAEPRHLLQHLELDWTGHEGLLIKLLKLRDAEVAIRLLESLDDDEDPRELDFGPIDWWIDWLVELVEKVSRLQDVYFLDRLSKFLSRCVSADARRTLVARFDAAEPHVKRALARSVLLEMSDLSSDDLGEGTLAFLMDDLRMARIDSFSGHLLGRIATDAFVVQRLLSLVSSEPGRFQENLRAVIRDAGRRHGRRYLPG